MTKDQILAVQRIGLGVLETIEEAGVLGAPGGLMYAALMSHGCTLNQFQSLMGTLLSRGFVSIDGESYQITQEGRVFIGTLRKAVDAQPRPSEPSV